MKGPLCRYCGTRIAKRTRVIWFAGLNASKDEYSERRTEKPTTRAEAQRYTNDEIVSVGYNEKDGVRYVWKVTIWDRTSYVDSFFCNGSHAKAFGYAAARAGHVMAAWQIAEARQNKESIK